MYLILKTLKRIIRFFAEWLLIATLGVWFSDSFVTYYAKPYQFESISELPKNKVALVLGTSKYSRTGNKNLFFTYRMRAAADLYKMGKIEHILVSGDNHVANYNEARDMLNTLISLGIPKSAITLDYAGFRTLDSVVRCKEVFGVQEVTIISQQFHTERAIFLARAHGIEAIAYTAKDPDYNQQIGKIVLVREKFARFKAMLDVLVGTKPKFLGKKEPIVVS